MYIKNLHVCICTYTVHVHVYMYVCVVIYCTHPLRKALLFWWVYNPLMNIDPHGRHIRGKGCTGVSQHREQGGLTPTLTEKGDTKIITCTSPTGTLKV